MTRLIIDGNSWLNAALLGGIDHDGGRKVAGPEGKPVQINSAQYGVDKFFDKLKEDLEHFSLAPRKAILVWDGPNAKLLRMQHLPQYKQGRDKVPEVNVELNKAREKVTQMMLDLGAHVVTQPGMEGDDVIAHLVRDLRTERNIISTSDGDLCVLVDENTDIWRLGKLNENPYGRIPHKYITLYKALVGDTSDKIPGAAGFGDAAWVELVRIFGLDGLDMMVELIQNDQLHRLSEDLTDFPKLKKIIDSKEQVTTSWRVASLMPERVNTLRKPLETRAGLVKQWDELDDDMRAHELRSFYGTKTLVHADNYVKARARVAALMRESPFVALDIETSSSEESDEWVANLMKATGTDRERIDVLGHELCGMSLTFGANTQHTIYMTVDHVETAGTSNITVDQCREMVEVIPQSKHIIIQNRSFEFSVLYRTWGDKWKDNGWHGFVPNALDTKLGASYTDENLPKGLKQRSLHHLGYVQDTYEATTTREAKVGVLGGGAVKKVFDKVVIGATYSGGMDENGDPIGALLSPAVTESWEARQYKMNELTAQDVFGYGCDDTICTAALHTHYSFVMELENTWQVYLDVETLPEYLTTLAFVQGVKVSLEKLREMERTDDAAYEKGWATLRAFLLTKGWDGTVCPEFEGTLEAADVKLAADILLDGEFSTRKRKLSGLAVDLREQYPDNVMALLLAGFTDAGDLAGINKLLKENFTGEPKINFGSPKQMQNLFYNVMGLTPRIFNPLTEKQRQIPEMKAAFDKLRKKKAGAQVTPTAEELALWISKASTDDDVVEFALAKDDLDKEQKEVLKAYQTVRSVMTRRNLFYKTYRAIPHWRDGRIHSSMNQCEAVTRRYSSSAPNLQQLPKLGEGGQFREVLLPHRADGVVVSCDFSSQELRALCHLSGDAELKSCYVGDNLRDVHSLTAVQASIYLWDAPVEYGEFLRMLESHDPEVKARAKALRAAAKTTVFAGTYGAGAENIAQQLMVETAVAQQFLDAKALAFPRVDVWKREVEESAANLGYALTMLGARRHLQAALLSPNSWERSKADRQASNFAIQGSSAEQTKLAMSEMWRRGLFTGKYEARFMAPVHDECVASVSKGDAVEFTREFHACMLIPYSTMSIPIVSSISLGRNFGEQEELGTVFDPDLIQETLDEIFHREEASV